MTATKSTAENAAVPHQAFGAGPVDESALQSFLEDVVADAGAAVSVLLAHVGDKLGLYAAMADAAPVTPDELAERTGTHERLVREWLANQAAGGYVAYDAATGRFRLPPEQAFVLAHESSPALVQGVFDLVTALYHDSDKAVGAFRTGTGLRWGDHHHGFYPAVDRSFLPRYRAQLLDWVAALDGISGRLAAGGQVADVGCGQGASTVLMATAYPRATFVGLDYHAPSIDSARRAAAEAGVDDRVSFEVADATALSGAYDLITFLDCWHDMADPVGAARAALRCLTDGGRVMVAEPFANDTLADNLTPDGRLGYGVSTLACIPCSVADGGPGLGAQAGESLTRQLFTEAGFASLRRVAESPLTIVYEARP